MKTIPVDPPLVSKDRSLPVTLIVMHGTAGGNVGGAISTLRARGLSYHYLIAKDGKVYKCCPSNDYAYHAGSSYGPRESAAKVSREQYPYTKKNASAGRVGKFLAGCSVNNYSVGISFVNMEDGIDPLTPEQIKSAVTLCRELKAAFPTITHITTHAQVSPRRKSDPKMLGLVSFVDAVNKGLKVADRVEAWKWGQ